MTRLNFHLLADQLLLGLLKNILFVKNGVSELVFKIIIIKKLFDSWRQKLIF